MHLESGLRGLVFLRTLLYSAFRMLVSVCPAAYMPHLHMYTYTGFHMQLLGAVKLGLYLCGLLWQCMKSQGAAEPALQHRASYAQI